MYAKPPPVGSVANTRSLSVCATSSTPTTYAGTAHQVPKPIVTRKDNPAWKRMAMRGLERSVNVGIPPGSGPHPNADGLTIADVAAINHEGTDTIPARKFIAVPLDGRTKEIRKYTERIAARILEGRDPDPLLDAFGQWSVKRVIQFINDRKYEANAESTKAKKGSDLPLVDKGILKAAITYAIEDKVGGGG